MSKPGKGGNDTTAAGEAGGLVDLSLSTSRRPAGTADTLRTRDAAGQPAPAGTPQGDPLPNQQIPAPGEGAPKPDEKTS